MWIRTCGWRDVKGVEELYDQIGDHVPAELHAEAAAPRERLSK